MFRVTFSFGRYWVLGAAVAVSAIVAMPTHAAIVSNGLTGNTEYDGWVNLTSSTLGSGTVGTTTLTTGFGSNEVDSGDGVLKRTSGGHYPASASLYSFSSHSTFEIAEPTALTDVKTVVFSILTWPNPDFGDGSTAEGALNVLPVLNYDGGNQALAADYTGAQFMGPFNGGGFNVLSYAYTFQWDLTSVGSITSFDIDWGQIVHTGVLALQLEQSDVFTVSPAAVPEPTALALVGLAGCGLLVSRLRHRFDKDAARP